MLSLGNHIVFSTPKLMVAVDMDQVQQVLRGSRVRDLSTETPASVSYANTSPADQGCPSLHSTRSGAANSAQW